ncbi:MAG: ATP synthase F1 subunit epsilon [Blastopirellula sp.]|nr:ATP synthase F1 subunit epsilon [Blastopirellula sp.]|tara:strand:+ start:102 stop:497 length:396 start_codon:yes stop_codon:yes gene_type:complete
MSGINCVVVTPESTALDVQAEFVAVPLFDGEKGIAAGHAPMIGRLGYGELRVKTSEGERRYYVDGGFVQVTDNTVSIITNRAIDAADVDRAAAEEQLQLAAKSPVDTDELLALRDKSVAQARAQLKVASRG